MRELAAAPDRESTKLVKIIPLASELDQLGNGVWIPGRWLARRSTSSSAVMGSLLGLIVRGPPC
jgi:hypothetical protein